MKQSQQSTSDQDEPIRGRFLKNQKKKGIKNDDLKEGEDNQQMGMPGGK